MYADRCSRDFIKGVYSFLNVAKANKRNGFMCCPCNVCRNEKDYLPQRPFISTCSGLVSCLAIIVGPSMEKEGL
jgi:hypothetical protein